MGNASYRQTTGNQFNNQDLRIYFQNDLPKFILQAKVGNGKFMKTYVMRVDSAPVVVKVYMKLNDEDLLVPAAHLTIMWKTLSPAKYPNLLPYQMWIKSTARFNKTAATPIYLIRQYFSSNLYDRLSTRPFLNELEKLWIVYQLFKCLEICHEHGIVHGDIKPENVMCTTSNWVILTDFSPFKPAIIPDDDPTDFQYYFDCMGRHRCYLAPERFQRKIVGGSGATPVPEESSTVPNFRSRMRGRGSRAPKKGLAAANASAFPSSTLTPAMDVFALGCLAAEILLDGVPLLDLPGMLKYVATTHTHAPLTGEKVPLTRLDQDESPARSLLLRIPNVHLRNVIIDMTQKDPNSRLTVSEYLDILQGKTSLLDPASALNIASADEPTTTLLPSAPQSLASSPVTGSILTEGTVLPPRPPAVSVPSAAQLALTVFPGYFDAGLYPLFLKMHWNGVTPDDRVNLICQSYGELIKSIVGVEDTTGAAFFASALSTGTAGTARTTGGAADPRHPTVVLPADPTASAKKPTPGPGANSTSNANLRDGSESVKHVRTPSGTLDAEQTSGNAAASQGSRAAQMSRASSAFLRQLHTGTEGNPTSTSAASARTATADVQAPLSTEDLLAQSEALIRDMEALFVSSDSTKATAGGSTKAVSQKASALSAAALSSNGSPALLARVREESILRQGASQVSREILSSATTNSKASVSWGGVEEIDGQGTTARPQHEGVVVLIDILHANYRHLKLPQSKIVCLMVLLRVGRFCTDAVILQCAVPLLLLGLEDQCAVVRAMSVRALRALLVLVRQFTAAESNIFPLYIFPSLTRISKDAEPSVRIAFAESVGSFAETAKRFLDVTHLALLNKAITEQSGNGSTNGGADGTGVLGKGGELLGADGVKTPDSPSPSPSPFPVAANGTNAIALQFPYDQKLEQLKEQVSRWIRDLMVEFSSNSASNNAANLSASTFAANSGAHSAGAESKRVCTVKRILLMDIMRLCAFFGQESTMDKLLTQLLTFLNDQDWELRHAFCAKIPSVCAFLGPTVTAECILPCIENAIYDVEEKVVLCAVHSLTSLVQMGLLTNLFIVDFVTKCQCLLLHPSESLRQAAVEFVTASATALGSVDAAVFVLPLVRNALRYDLSGLPLTSELLSHALVAGISRRAYRAALLKRLSELSAMYTSSQDQGAANGPVESISIIKGAEMYETDASEDARKIALIQSYLDLAAREINTKTMQWRNGLASSMHQQNLQQQQLARMSAKPGAKSLPAPPTNANLLRNVGLSPGSDPALPKNNLFSLLDLTALPLPEHTVQSLLVPHQKYGTFLYRPLAEETRRHPIFLDMDGVKNNNKLKMLFGVSIRQGDSARALAIGNQWDTVDSMSYAEAIASNGGAAGSLSTLAPAYGESLLLLKRIKALDVPPLAPDTGHLMQATTDNRFYSGYTEALDVSGSLDGPGRTAWRPKEGVLLTTLKEHSGPVNRLIVSPDQSFFASGSADKTVKIWQTKQLDRVAFPKSAVTYKQHRGEVIDLAPIENSHSIASASSDGAIHIWRVDMQGNSGSTYNSGGINGAGPAPASSVDSLHDDFTANMGNIGVVGLSQVRILDPSEGAVLCVNHFNSDVASLVTYATQRGGLHGWDLRAAKEAMHLPMRPELGYATSMTISPDRNWICMGTSKGFVSLFDIRYNVPSKLWRHSSHSAIHRLACCKAPKAASNAGASAGMPQSEGAFLFVAAGNNEAAVWGIPEGGECCKCFRSVSLDASRGPVAPLPWLEEITLPRRPHAPIRFQDSVQTYNNPRDDSVKAIIGRISQSNQSYLVTAGTDRSIRFWDFAAPNRCFTISGLEAAQPKAIFDAPKLSDGSSGKLFVCYVAATPSVDKILQMHLPAREGRGIVLPSANAKDAILDLKNIDLPMKLMLSSNRDGEIKLWR